MSAPTAPRAVCVVRRATLAMLPLLLVGCGTLSLPSMQPMQILAFDALDRPVVGLTCTVSNVFGTWQVKTPATEATVRRSHSDLEIECRRGTEVAMGTVAPRRDRVEQALVPFGSVAVAIDHLTGHLYSYPSVVRLRLGQHLRFGFSTEASATGLIATVGETLIADLGASAPPPQQPLPAAGATSKAAAGTDTARPAARPRRATAPASAPSTAARAGAPSTTVSGASAAGTAPAAPRANAPVTW